MRPLKAESALVAVLYSGDYESIIVSCLFRFKRR
jgi:hypothetical protein